MFIDLMTARASLQVLQECLEVLVALNAVQFVNRL